MSDPFFDTNIVIDWLQRRVRAADELSLYRSHLVSRVAWSEVLAGGPIASRDWAKRMIEPFAVVELDEQIAGVAADIRHRTRMKLLDAFILATARVHGALLVTRNTRDFPTDMPGIRVSYTL